MVARADLMDLSSGLISLTSQIDQNYTKALRAARELEGTPATILVPYDVYAETVNMVGKKQGHAKAYEVGQFLSTTAPFWSSTARLRHGSRPSPSS